LAHSRLWGPVTAWILYYRHYIYYTYLGYVGISDSAYLIYGYKLYWNDNKQFKTSIHPLAPSLIGTPSHWKEMLCACHWQAKRVWCTSKWGRGWCVWIVVMSLVNLHAKPIEQKQVFMPFDLICEKSNKISQEFFNYPSISEKKPRTPSKYSALTLFLAGKQISKLSGGRFACTSGSAPFL